jgi:hypothetical protein
MPAEDAIAALGAISLKSPGHRWFPQAFANSRLAPVEPWLAPEASVRIHSGAEMRRVLLGVGWLAVAGSAAPGCGSDDNGAERGTGGVDASAGGGGLGAGGVIEAGAGGASGSAGSAGAASGGAAGADAGTDADASCSSATGYGAKDVVIAGCNGIAPGSEACHFQMRWKSAGCCEASKCSRLVVYWAGGNQTCDTGAFVPLLEAYADRGFVAACAQPFTTEVEGGKYPYHVEFDRMHHLMQEIRAQAAGLWDGSKLLISGVSHGATAPAVAIASRKALATYPAVWLGGSHTAVVLFDGISNPKTLEEWAGAQPAGSGCGLFHQRFVGRYGDGAPLLHGCNNGACYCSSPAHAEDWNKDTVLIGSESPPGPYQCADFTPAAGSVLYRHVSCSGVPGSNACGLAGDIIPDSQQLLAHQAIKDCPGVVASYANYDCAHTLCGAFSPNCGGDDAVAWLEANGW